MVSELLVSKNEKLLQDIFDKAKSQDDLAVQALASKRLFELSPVEANRARFFDLLLVTKPADEAQAFFKSEILALSDQKFISRYEFRLNLQLGKIFEALEIWELEGYDETHAIRLANEAIKRGYFDIVEYLLKRHEKQTTHFEWWRIRFFLELATQGLDAARALFEENKPHIPEIQCLFTELELLSFSGRHYQVFQTAKAAMQTYSDNQQLWRRLFEAAQQCDHVLEVLQILENFEIENPNPFYLRLKVEAYSSILDIKGAGETLHQLRTMSEQQYQDARFTFVAATQDANAVEEAYQKLATLEPSSPWLALRYMNWVRIFAADTNKLTKYEPILRKNAELYSGNIALQHHYLHHLIAIGKIIEAAQYFECLPKGFKTLPILMPIKLTIDKHLGMDDDYLASGWSDFLIKTAHLSLNAPEAYPQIIHNKLKGRIDTPLAVTTVFNSIEYIDWFLNYYRKLGVSDFIMIDNASTDGTFEALEREPDVTLYRANGSFSKSQCGVFWANHVIRKHGVGRWLFHLDIDEAFTFPLQKQGRSLAQLMAYLDRQGARAMQSNLLDVYGKKFDTDGDFSDQKLTDCNLVTHGEIFPPYQNVQGGVRKRLTGRSPLLTKSAFVKPNREFAYLTTNHFHTHLKFTDITGALLHYKFIGQCKERFDEAIERNEHFMGAYFYKHLESGLKNRGAFYNPDISIGITPAQLVNRNLVKTTKNWKDFKV